MKRPPEKEAFFILGEKGAVLSKPTSSHTTDWIPNRVENDSKRHNRVCPSLNYFGVGPS
jgi:hypothetical protein